MTEKRILVKQVKSAIGRDQLTRRRLATLGLGRIGKETELPANPAVLGMLKNLTHLISISEIK